MVGLPAAGGMPRLGYQPRSPPRSTGPSIVRFQIENLVENGKGVEKEVLFDRNYFVYKTRKKLISCSSRSQREVECVLKCVSLPNQNIVLGYSTWYTR